jgi:hypothetical protein
MMRKYIFLVFIIIWDISFANEEAKVNKLVDAHNLVDPALYEIVSPTNGNVIYVYKDRAGNVEMQVVGESLKTQISEKQ